MSKITEVDIFDEEKEEYYSGICPGCSKNYGQEDFEYCTACEEDFGRFFRDYEEK